MKPSKEEVENAKNQVKDWAHTEGTDLLPDDVVAILEADKKN